MNYQIIIYDCILRKIINKHILHNATEEQAQENCLKSREYFTYITGHFCDGKIKKVNK